MKSCISLNEVWRPHKSQAGGLVGEQRAQAWLVVGLFTNNPNARTGAAQASEMQLEILPAPLVAGQAWKGTR